MWSLVTGGNGSSCGPPSVGVDISRLSVGSGALMVACIDILWREGRRYSGLWCRAVTPWLCESTARWEVLAGQVP
jgi:hypothetical protein